MSSTLANFILVLHALVVLVNVGALPLIRAGHVRGWAFVRNFYFRITHLLLVGFVAAESALGILCPLTAWEDALRSTPVERDGFIAYWVHRLLFYDFPGWVFTGAYLLFFGLVAVTFYCVPPQTVRSRDVKPHS